MAQENTLQFLCLACWRAGVSRMSGHIRLPYDPSRAPKDINIPITDITNIQAV
ncbi:hypothetical protein RSAG8_01459, partial [Rhizoctonia solani AG-8 WAC10335]